MAFAKIDVWSKTDKGKDRSKKKVVVVVTGTRNDVAYSASDGENLTSGNGD